MSFLGYFALAGLVAALVFLLFLLFTSSSGARHLRKKTFQDAAQLVAAQPVAKILADESRELKNGVCPLCGERIERPGRLRTVAVSSSDPREGRSGDGAGGRFILITGCPACKAGGPNVEKRRCPVCGGEVEAGKGLAALLFGDMETPSHVQVLGCPACKRAKRSA